MHYLPVLISLVLIVPLTYISVHKLYPELVRKKAIMKLEELLFPKGHWQKSEVLKTFRSMTGSRFTDEEILDYFYKIKGLQSVNVNSKTNFWIKKYLFTPTAIRLNYFEQVKFYETFLNFPLKANTTEKGFSRQGNSAQKQNTAEYAPQMSKHNI